jgi:hypothetical protein
MLAIPDRVFEAMDRNISNLFARQVGLLPFGMTHVECLQLVAPKEHHEVLTTAAKYANVKSSQDYMLLNIPAEVDGETGQQVFLMMRIPPEIEPPLCPRDPQWQPQQTGEKVIEYLSARYALGRKFGLVRHVLYELNRICDNGTQVRNILPGVLHLCELTDNLNFPEKVEAWAAKHAAFKPCKTLPALTPALKAAVREASAVLAVASLLGSDVPEECMGQVVIMTYGNAPQFSFHGQLINRVT